MKHLRLAFALLLSVVILSAMAFAVTAPAAKTPPRSRPPAAAQMAAPAPAETASASSAQLVDEVAKEVEALRGWTFRTPLKKQVCSPQEVRRYLEKQIEKQCPGNKVGQTQAFLKMVGLLPPETDLKKMFLDLLEDQVGGFYDSETKSLYLVERTGKTEPAIERILLAHELTHALDDQQVDIEKCLKPLVGQTEEMDLVAASVMEGSATSLMTQYMSRAVLTGRMDLSALQEYATAESQRSKSLSDAPRYFTAMIGTYMCGMQFLAKGNLASLLLAPDNKAIGEAFLAATKDPPRSTEQIIHPEKYWDAAKCDEPVVVADNAVAKLLAQGGRWIVHKDTVGEMLCAILTTPKGVKPNLMAMSMASAWTNAGAAGWGGDRFYLLASGPSADEADKTLKDAKGVWITLWDTPQDRDEFIQAYEAGAGADLPHAVFRLGNLGAVLFFGFSDAERKALEEKFEKSPPQCTRGGKPWAPWAM